MLITETDNRHRPQRHSSRRLLDRHILPAYLRSHDALRGVLERYLRSSYLSPYVPRSLHHWIHCLLRLAPTLNPHRWSLRTRSWRRWCHHSKLGHLHRYRAVEVSFKVVWYHVSFWVPDFCGQRLTISQSRRLGFWILSRPSDRWRFC